MNNEFWIEDWYDIQDYARRYLEDLRDAKKLLEELITIFEKIVSTHHEDIDKYQASELVERVEEIYSELLAILHLEDIDQWFRLGRALRYE